MPFTLLHLTSVFAMTVPEKNNGRVSCDLNEIFNIYSVLAKNCFKEKIWLFKRVEL